MASEAKRGIIRIVSNYVRLGCNLLLGLVLVPVLLRAVGDDGYALIALAGASVGIGAMIESIIRNCMIRELGSVFHNDRARFKEFYNSAFLLAVIGGALSALIYLALITALPLLGVPGEALYAARIFVVAKAAQSIGLVVLAPAFNMYTITERMVQFNGWATAERACMLIAALSIYVLDVEAEWAVAVYGIISAGLTIGVNLLACVTLIIIDSSFVPTPSVARWRTAFAMAKVGGWNVVVLAAASLHIRLSQLMIAMFLGMVPYNALFGVAVQMSGYIFQLGGGVAAGVSAVASRLSNDPVKLRKLIHHSTRLQGLVAFPGLVVMIVLAEPVIHVWVGDRLQNPNSAIPQCALLLQILAIGFTVKALVNGWFHIFYGAGYIRIYAPTLLLGGIANPVIGGALLFLFPEELRYTAMAWSFSFAFVIFSFILAPLRTAPHVGLRGRDLYLPLLRPATLGLACSPILITARISIDDWNLLKLAAILAAYGGVYALLAILFVLSQNERRRFIKLPGVSRPAVPEPQETDA